MAQLFTVQAPAPFWTTNDPFGNQWTSDAYGFIYNVTAGSLKTLLNAGCILNPVTTDGLIPAPLPLSNFKQPTGIPLTAAAGAGFFGLTFTPGTAEYLVSEAAQGNTKTDTAYADIVLPPTFVPGTAVTITTNVNTSGTGTPSVETVGAVAYLKSNSSAESANLVATAAQTISGTPTDYAFTITGATLVPGANLTIGVQTVLTVGSTASLTAHINSVRLS